MTTSTVTAATIKAYLLNGCGYQTDLVKDDYQFARDNTVDVAAFAHYPSDARSACIAAVDCKTNDPEAEVLACRELGAPLVFTCLRNKAQVWKPGQAGAKCLEKGLSGSQVRNFFAEHEANLSPRRIYEAKTRGRLPGSQSRLPFVDLQLLPFAEKRLGDTLTTAVVEVISQQEDAFGPGQPTEAQWDWIYTSTFRLLAGKALKDKKVPGFVRLDLGDLATTLEKVRQHYGSDEAVHLGNKAQREALQAGSKIFENLGNLQHLTTETLADVYERALVTKTTRKQHGTHATPSYLVDYILWQLAPWIEEMPPADFQVFEPACGHAPFLVGMIRLLRAFDWKMTDDELGRFCRQRLHGIERDSFAVEIARLSLTVADVPHSNGWKGITVGNMFEIDVLEEAARNCRVMLANPPFEGDKPLQLLERTLPNLPPGAVFGVIVPSTLLFTTDKVKPPRLRRWLLENCQLAEVSLFPDKIFKFADHECAVLLGRRRNSGAAALPTSVRCRRVREAESEAFRQDYHFTTDRLLPQSKISERPDDVLWVPELEEEVWTWLNDLPRFESVATMGQGVRYIRDVPAGAKSAEEEPFPGATPGYLSSEGNWSIHETPPLGYLNLSDERLFHRKGSGTTTGVPQIVLNYRAASRGPWRLKPFIDRVGRPVKGNFLTVRPRKKKQLPLEYLWAILVSPLANAYVFTHGLKRDVLISDLNKMPFPKVERWAIDRVVKAAQDYLAAAGEGLHDLFNEGVTEERLNNLLQLLDAEVLRLYGLPAAAEKQLLDLFQEQRRPGTLSDFRGYYPRHFSKAVPLYAFLSNAYQQARDGQVPVLTESQQQLYDSLIATKSNRKLDVVEESTLYQLQAELDGRDFAVLTPNRDWLRMMKDRRKQAQAKLSKIADKLSGLVDHGTTPNENPTR